MSTAPGRRPTISAVAERAGVSVATVSYVLSGRSGRSSGVSTATAERVTRVADELGYHANRVARTMRTGRSGLALLSLTMLADPWSQSVSDAVNAATAGTALRPLVLADGDWGALLDSYPVDVAFIDAGGPEDLDRLVDLARRGQRLVVFSEELEPQGFDVIRSPAIPGCELAVQHLLDGYHRVGALASGRPDAPSRRLVPFTDGIHASGRELREPDVQFYDNDHRSAYAAALRLLDRSDRPDAVYATTDFAAVAAIHAAQQLGLRVPEDVAVVGVGNADDAARMTPSLTSVGPVGLFTQLAALLVRAADDPAPAPRCHDFPWMLHHRQSTGGPATATTDHLDPGHASS